MRLMLPVVLILIAHARADWLDRYRGGEHLLEQGRTDEALGELRASLQQLGETSGNKAGLGAVFDALGRAEMNAGRYRQARKFFERSTGCWDDRSEALAVALANSGHASQALGEYARAEMLFRRSLEILPQRPMLWRALGGVLFHENHYAEAEAAERSALSHADPETTADVWNDLSVLYEAQHKTREAKTMLEKAIAASQPGRARAIMLHNLGIVEWKLRSRQEAEAYLRQALEEMESAAGPQHPDVCRILDAYSVVLHQAGKKLEAKQIARRAQVIRSSFAADTNVDQRTVDWRDLQRTSPR